MYNKIAQPDITNAYMTTQMNKGLHFRTQVSNH